MGQQGQQSHITRDRAYIPNSQVNSFLALQTYSSQNWMLLNHGDCLFIFRNMSEEPAKCEGASNKFGPRGSKFGPAFRTMHLDLQEAPDWDGHNSSLRRLLEAHRYSLVRSWSLLSDGSNLVIRFIWSWAQSAKEHSDLQAEQNPSFWAFGPCFQ
jgi:hypothetical protein